MRTPKEWATGILPHAVTINILDLPNFIAAIEKLDRSKAIFMYCRSGARSAQACNILDSFGYLNTYNLIGGITGWDGKIISWQENTSAPKPNES